MASYHRAGSVGKGQWCRPWRYARRRSRASHGFRRRRDRSGRSPTSLKDGSISGPHLERHARPFYRTPLDGSRPAGTSHTLGDQPGCGQHIMAPGGRAGVSHHLPVRHGRREWTSSSCCRISRCGSGPTPSALSAAIAPIVSRPVEFMTVEVGDGVSLDGWVLKPSQFDLAEVSGHRVHLR